MKYAKLLQIAVMLLSAIGALNAQTGDWLIVEKVPAGSMISVSRDGHRGRPECELLRVTDSDLSCSLRRGAFEKKLVFLRSEVKEIRSEQPGHDHTVAGAVLGGAAGGVLGGVVAGISDDPETRVLVPVFSVIGGAAIGAGVGRGRHQHGPVLYKRP